MRPRRILLCTDFSENSEPAGRIAVDYARAFAAHLMIFHVIDSSRIGYPSIEGRVPIDIKAMLERIEESVSKALELFASQCRNDLPEVTTHHRVGIPVTEIVRFATEEPVELIVMGTHGWTGLRHLILGSTAENVVRRAACPVLTVRSSAG
jgi:universal stress protein A